MRIAIWSHSASARAGGGVIYVWGIARALAADHTVDLYCRPTLDPAQLIDVMPNFGGGLPTILQDPCSAKGRRLAELCRARVDRRYDLVIVQSTRVARYALGKRTVLLCEFPASRSLTWGERLRLRRFDQVVANAAYTASWIDRRWGRAATVLHPPVVPIAPRPKQPIILGVGRFVDGGRSKRQLDLVRSFRRLRERPEASAWALHLAGFPADQRYVERVRAEAEDLPVTLHLDLPRPDLETLFGEASIFWHAVGEGLDPETEPERMEHFGIVTVEAMSAGCVPVVIDRGGQSEIVSGGGETAGVLWQDFDGCLSSTLALIGDPIRRAALAEKARQRAETFTFQSFARRAHNLLADDRDRAAPEPGP